MIKKLMTLIIIGMTLNISVYEGQCDTVEEFDFLENSTDIEYNENDEVNEEANNQIINLSSESIDADNQIINLSSESIVVDNLIDDMIVPDIRALENVNLMEAINGTQESGIQVSIESIGNSGNGRSINAYRISHETDQNPRELLLVFAIHGFEDYSDYDGAYLVDIGYALINHYREELVQGYALTIIPLANPDGLIEGVTNNGVGRTQLSLEVDINRDFDYNFVANRQEDRNKTLSVAFSTPEAQALRDLVLSKEWYVIIDFHGWLNGTIGDPSIAYAFDLPYEGDFENSSGTFSAWASFYADSLLVEYPETVPETGEIAIYTEATIKSLDTLMSDI